MAARRSESESYKLPLETYSRMVRFGTKSVTAQTPTNGDADVLDPPSDWQRDRDLVHEPARLQMMALAVREGGADFQAFRIKLGITDTEVAAHAKRLEAAGLLESTRAIGGTGMVITFQATARGREAMQAYCDWMRDVLQGLPGST